MKVSELIALLSTFEDQDAIVRIPENDGGAPVDIRFVELHQPVYRGDMKPFVWVTD